MPLLDGLGDALFQLRRQVNGQKDAMLHTVMILKSEARSTKHEIQNPRGIAEEPSDVAVGLIAIRCPKLCAVLTH